MGRVKHQSPERGAAQNCPLLPGWIKEDKAGTIIGHGEIRSHSWPAPRSDNGIEERLRSPVLVSTTLESINKIVAYQ
jgi:hypothetical protein